MKIRIGNLVMAHTLFAAIVGVVILGFSTGATAGFYKCVDGSGATTYSQTPCPEDEMTTKIINSGGAPTNPGDCRIAQHFMAKTSRQMLQGAPSDVVYNAYGGIDSIPRTSVALINYVYTFQYNKQVSAERITALSMARCKSGSFGSTTCDDFPFSYIESRGGCEAAATGVQSHSAMSSDEYDSETPTGGVDINALQQTLQALQAQAGQSNPSSTNAVATPALQRTKSECINKVGIELSNVTSQMRSGGSASQQDSLRAQKRKLQKKLSAC